MSQVDTRIDDALELAMLLHPSWPSISAGIRASGVPVCEGDDGENGDADNGDDDGDGEGTQTFDREYVQKLRGENAAARKRAQEAEARAKQFEDRDKSEIEKATEHATQAEQRAAAAELKLNRYDAAVAAGLDPKYAGRLQGATPDELKTDAEQLLKDLGGKERTTFDGGPRDKSHTGNRGGMDGFIRQQAGRG